MRPDCHRVPWSMVHGPWSPWSIPMYRLELRFPGPLDIPRSLEGFRRWGDDQLDRWDGTTLLRTIPDGRKRIAFCGEALGTVRRPVLALTVARESHVEPVRRAVSKMFITATRSLAALGRTDPVVARLHRLYPGVRPVLQIDPFTALVRSISAQQVNLQWAAVTRSRLAARFGTRHRVGRHLVWSLSPRRLAEARIADLRSLQFSTAKAESIHALAVKVHEGVIDLNAMPRLPDNEVVSQLIALRGIGRWTAEWFLARTLGRPCVVAGDLGVRKAVGKAYLKGKTPSEAEVREITAHWGEAAAVAQQLLLYALMADTL